MEIVRLHLADINGLIPVHGFVIKHPRAGAILVDVREPAEYRAAHIPQARLMPLSEVDVDRLPGGKKIVVHCAKGGRGHTACEKLLQQNSSLEIFNLAGGIEGWAAAGLPVERAM